MEPKDEVTPLALGQNDVSFEDFKDNMPQRSDLLNQIKNMDNSDGMIVLGRHAFSLIIPLKPS